jgi:serine/threonine protein phosphatase PrpC
MKPDKLNCWEYMKCGRQPGGRNIRKAGICPAAAAAAFNGFNQGKNAGRICWLVAGTFCGGKPQGTFAEKYTSCRQCKFYRKVHAEESATNQTIDSMNIFAASHIGRVRKANEDRYLIRALGDGSILLAVADGLGGEVAGDYAAEIVMGKLAGIDHIRKGREQQQLAVMAKEADLAVNQEAAGNPDLGGMGSTLICALLRNKYVYWVHVGDSRLYILHSRQLTQLTEDQTFARFLLQEGEITAAQAPTHYSRHILDQTVGCGICEPETGRRRFDTDDLLILTSDGLHKKIPAETMLALLTAGTALETKAKSLVEAALDCGGKDNITVVMAGKSGSTSSIIPQPIRKT